MGEFSAPVVRFQAHCCGLGSPVRELRPRQAMGELLLIKKKKDNFEGGGKRSIQTIQQSLAVSCWSMAGKGGVRED